MRRKYELHFVLAYIIQAQQVTILWNSYNHSAIKIDSYVYRAEVIVDTMFHSKFSVECLPLFLVYILIWFTICDDDQSQTVNSRSCTEKHEKQHENNWITCEFKIKILWFVYFGFFFVCGFHLQQLKFAVKENKNEEITIVKYDLVATINVYISSFISS